jgi:hypothetical protein
MGATGATTGTSGSGDVVSSVECRANLAVLDEALGAKAVVATTAVERIASFIIFFVRYVCRKYLL